MCILLDAFVTLSLHNTILLFEVYCFTFDSRKLFNPVSVFELRFANDINPLYWRQTCN